MVFQFLFTLQCNIEVITLTLVILVPLQAGLGNFGNWIEGYMVIIAAAAATSSKFWNRSWS